MSNQVSPGAFEALNKLLGSLTDDRDELKRRLDEVENTHSQPDFVPHRLRGDGPCGDCGTRNNIVWFTDSVFWNKIMREGMGADARDPILCLPCFVIRVDSLGYKPAGWRVLPEWPYFVWPS